MPDTATPRHSSLPGPESSLLFGSQLEMLNDRLYKFWSRLEETFRRGKSQNEVMGTGSGLSKIFYDDPATMKQFLEAMSDIQMGSILAIASIVISIVTRRIALIPLANQRSHYL